MWSWSQQLRVAWYPRELLLLVTADEFLSGAYSLGRWVTLLGRGGGLSGASRESEEAGAP